MAPNTVKLDPVYAAACEEAKKRPKIDESMIPYFPEMNKSMDESFKKKLHTLPKVIEKDKTVTYNGTELQLTLFRPLETENELLPVVIFYHGGGWVFGSKYTYAKVIRDICTKCHVAIVFLSYTLAPEAKFPMIHEEAYSTLCWVLENGDSIVVNVQKLAVCGDSAGGNLASVIPLMAKDRNLGDVIKAQIMIYPAIVGSDKIYDSYELFGNGDYGLTIAEGMFFHKLYFGDAEKTKLLSPLLATTDELRGLPPALVLMAEADIIRDLGEEYAGNLLEAGVPTAATRLLGSIHGYFDMGIDSPVYIQTISMIVSHLKAAFGNTESKL
ncbi:Alpha/Beta hydrolase protein [Fennellomyces sp. T-0311]|nr:Alpha/Beta hydrolase protein [Fennellomyces sp. T-0311]